MLSVEDAVSGRTNVRPLIETRASHCCAGLVLFLGLTRVRNSLKSQEREAEMEDLWKNICLYLH